MTLRAKVVNEFRESGHDDRVYQPGDTYPAEGYESNNERIYFLSEIHPKLKKIYLADIQEIESADPPSADTTETSGKDVDNNDEGKTFPHHVGGGTYELSNGEKVKGKEEAQEAEAALKE